VALYIYPCILYSETSKQRGQRARHAAATSTEWQRYRACGRDPSYGRARFFLADVGQISLRLLTTTSHCTVDSKGGTDSACCRAGPDRYKPQRLGNVHAAYARSLLNPCYDSWITATFTQLQLKRAGVLGHRYRTAARPPRSHPDHAPQQYQ